MNTGSLQLELQRPYRRETWQTLLPQIFPGVELFTQAAEKTLTTEAERALATGLRQIGRAVLRDENGSERIIAIFEAEVVPSVDVVRNRVALRQLVSRCIDEVSAHAVLAFFVQPGAPAYRLTYAAKESVHREDLTVETIETATKRYTYVLGPGEARRTAAQRLSGLAANRDTAKWKDVADAFSVEKLNDEFFKTYKEHYLAFCKHLLDSTATAAVFDLKLRGLKDKELDKALKPVRDFVKKLLGRLVFLHFIQKKQWLGCPADRTAWTDGDPEFVQTWFAKRLGRDRFYRDFLVPLFYDALNNNARERSLFAPTGTRVPYLNGGLFERELVPGSGHKPLEVEKLDLPDALFAGLLEFLSQYNFTIDENDPDDHEIGIDPEMLGHIFENLLEDNKDKGAYYTPKAIVQYMCQQSLIHYLQGHFQDDPAAPAEIERLIRLKEPVDPRDSRNWLTGHAHRLEELLDDVKICDPAIGSGAFPIGLLQEIYWTRLTLHPGMGRAKAKRDIIQKSIHGVDIDAGAVEIARLRCWLALIVEEEQPRPLPNLDFKIMQGDSLLESFEGIPLDQLMPSVRPLYERAVQQKELDLGSVVREKLQLELSEEDRVRFAKLLGDYFPCEDPAEKNRLHAEIDAFVLKHIDYNVDQFLRKEEAELAQLQHGIDEKRKKAKKYELSPREKRRIKSLEADICANRARKAKLHGLADIPERPYFLWHLFFQDVFARGGFDIVIANPPYGAEFADGSMESLCDQYEVAGKNPDSFALFIEKAVSIAKSSAHICMIVPTGWYSGTKSWALRRFLATATDPGSFVMLPYDMFQEAWVDTTIFLTMRRAHRLVWPRSESHKVLLKAFPKRHKLKDSEDFLTDRRQVDFASWFQDGNDEFLTLASEEELRLIRKIRKAGVPLGKIADVQRGVTPFVLHNAPTHENSQQAFNGTVRRYRLEQGPPRFIRYDESLAEYKPSRYFEGPRLLLRELISRQFRLQATFVSEDFVTNKSMQSIVPTGDSPNMMFLLGVLNSRLMSWYFLACSNIAHRDDFPKIVLDETRSLPIAVPGLEVQTRIAALVQDIIDAKKHDPNADTTQMESDIDQRIRAIYDLNSDECGLIEKAASSVKPELDHKTTLFTRVLPEVSGAAPYFSMPTVEGRMTELQLTTAEASLQSYMSEAMKKGIVHDAGRGWYSRMADPFALNTKPIKGLISRVEKVFPLLEFFCWSTEQVNPYMHHLLAKFATFVYADRDLMSALFDEMQGWKGYRVYLDPRKADAAKFRIEDKTVVIRPATSEAPPPAEPHAASIEQLLVDLTVEIETLPLMSRGELQDMAWRVATSGRLTIPALLRYARRCHRTPEDMFGGNWSTIGTNA